MIESISEELLDEIANRVSERLFTETAQTGDLQSRYEEFSKEHVFKPGMLVCWKQGLRNRKFPDYGEVGIVVEVLTEPFYDTVAESGSPYFREPLDILIALISDDDFIIFHYDKRRFEPAQDRLSERVSPWWISGGP
jgi:hypothetical protein